MFEVKLIQRPLAIRDGLPKIGDRHAVLDRVPAALSVDVDDAPIDLVGNSPAHKHIAHPRSPLRNFTSALRHVRGSVASTSWSNRLRTFRNLALRYEECLPAVAFVTAVRNFIARWKSTIGLRGITEFLWIQPARLGGSK